MIEINNLTTGFVDKKFLEGVAKKVLKGENRKENKKDFNISIVLVGQGRMKKLNKKYRGENRVTDILSFGNELDEIVICLREVKKNAKKYNSTFKKELARVLTHGILHLLGYNHKEMQKKEEYYVKAIHY